MALTDQIKNDVMFYLGYPGKVLVPSSTHFHRILVDRLDNLTPEIESRVGKTITRMKKLEEQFEDAACRFTASKVDGIVVNKNERSLLKAELNRYRNQLSELLDIPNRHKSGSQINVVS